MTEEHDLPIGVLRVDAHNVVVGANAAAVTWFEQGALVGMAVDELIEPATDFLDGVGASSTMMVQRADPDKAALVSRRESGDGAVLTLLDASDRYESGHRLRQTLSLADRTRERLELVIEASIAFSQATTDARLAEILADTAARAYRAEESVVLLSGPSGSLEIVGGSIPFSHEQAVPFADSIRYRQVMTISGVDEADSLSRELGEVMRASGTHAMIVAPVYHEDETYGVFACFFHHPRTFDHEAAPLADALAGHAGQVLATVRLQTQLEHAATHDATTQLPNRRRLEQQASTYEGHGDVAVIFIDLDGFKAVNDTLGHLRGDDVLREVGRRLTGALRESDTVARFGGDEFVVVCEVEHAEHAHDIAHRLREAIQEPYGFLPRGMSLGASIGVSLGRADNGVLPIDALVRAADHAMYRAKTSGGNRVQAYG